MTKILIACGGEDWITLDEIKDLQGKDFKLLTDINYTKLKKSIIKHNFSFPFMIYKEKEEKYILDGHQRHHVLKKMKQEGVDIPDKFPCIYIEAKDKKEAREKLLVLNSQYGKITEDGIANFFTEYNIDLPVMDDLSFAGINMGLFGTGHNSTNIQENIKKDEEELAKIPVKKTIECPHCGETIEI